MREASELTTHYSWWRNALKGDVGPIHADRPCAGFYRKRQGRGGPFIPAAVWLEQPKDENGELDGDERFVCLVGFRGTAAKVDAEAEWAWLAKNPISEELYRAAFEAGRWPDDAPEVPTAPGIGHNMPSDDPAEAIRVELGGEAEIVAEFLAKPVETQGDADKIGPWTKRIGEIGKRAESAHKVEKQPHLDAGRAVDAKWKPIVEDAKALVARLKKHVEPFLLAKKREEDERAREAAEEARKLREQAAAADQQSAQERAALERKAREAEEAAKPKNASAGRTGAKVALRTERRARVTDYKAAANAMLDANHAELKEKIDQLAQRAVKAGIPLAGVEVEEISRAA